MKRINKCIHTHSLHHNLPNLHVFVLVAFVLCACSASRPLPTIAVLPSDTPRSGTLPAITIVATLAVDIGKPTLQSPPTTTLTFTPLFEPSPTSTTIAPTSADQPVSTPLLTAAVNGESAKREVATCERIVELFSTIQTDNKGEFPDDFPKPPDGSVACGIDGPGSVHFSNTQEPNVIANYYREKLKAWGCAIAQDEVFKPNWITIRFACPKGVVHVATNPDITEFIVRYVAH